MNESIEYQTLKAEELVSKCMNEPYLLSGDSDIEYLEVVKKYPTRFIADHNAIFYHQCIKDFWLKEIETFFFFSSKEEVRLLDIVTLGLVSFSNLFKIDHPILPIEFADASYRERMPLDYIDAMEYEYSRLTFEEKVVEFIKNNLVHRTTIFEFRVDDKCVIIQRMTNNHISALSEVKKLLRIVHENRIPLNVLCHKLNSSDSEFDIKKPIDQSKLREAILYEKNGSFEIDSADNVILVSETEFLPKYFFDNRELLTNFNFNKSTSGILAFSYLGNKFPLKEAEEYVNVRPIIHLALVKNLKEEFPKLIADLAENEQFVPEREFMFFLKAILPEDASVEEWLNENIAVSFYEEDAQDLKLVMPKIIGHLSPVFNLAHNPGHLFTYTLQKKREEYEKRNKRELKDGN